MTYLPQTGLMFPLTLAPEEEKTDLMELQQVVRVFCLLLKFVCAHTHIEVTNPTNEQRSVHTY